MNIEKPIVKTPQEALRQRLQMAISEYRKAVVSERIKQGIREKQNKSNEVTSK